jgi:hypothetical protein
MIRRGRILTPSPTNSKQVTNCKQSPYVAYHTLHIHIKILCIQIRHDTLKLWTSLSFVISYITYVHTTCVRLRVRFYGNLNLRNNNDKSHAYKTVFTCKGMCYIDEIRNFRIVTLQSCWWLAKADGACW